MSQVSPVVVVASAARTTTGNSGPLYGPKDQLNLNVLVNVTAVSGTTPSMTVSVEWSDDGGATFAQLDGAGDAFTAITAASEKVKQFPMKAPIYRLVWTISGTTPSFTFSISADSPI